MYYQYEVTIFHVILDVILDVMLHVMLHSTIANEQGQARELISHYKRFPYMGISRAYYVYINYNKLTDI